MQSIVKCLLFFLFMDCVRAAGGQPLPSFASDCEGRGARCSRTGLMDGPCIPPQPSAGTSEEGLGQARRSDGAMNPSHLKGLGTEPALSAHFQDDMASRISK